MRRLLCNRHFAVVHAVSGDAHVAYHDKADDVKRILSVQVEPRLSKNLSCQYEGEGGLLQVKTRHQGLSLREANVRVHCHQEERMELLWQGTL